MKKSRVPKYVVVVLVLLIAAAGVYYYVGPGSGETEEEYLTVDVTRGTVRRTVSSTGTLQAVITVQVGSQVSGRIQELYADFNSVVKKGQTLAVIDPANFEAQLERAKASLATAEATVKSADANLINRQAELLSSKANVQASQVTLEEAERQLKRSQELSKDRVISEQELENAQAVADQAVARLSQAKAQVSQVKASIRSAEAQRDQSAANVKQARAELKMARVNLHYTNITSPIDGVVIERNVDIGQTVAASFQAPILFLIANDLSKMQVIAQIDEADIGAISERADVDFTVDAFPRQSFSGRISEIRLSSKLPNTSSTNTPATGGGATNVVVYNVIIDVDNPQLKLRPAMTANVTFTVARVEDTLKIANAALRYRPADKDREEIEKMLPPLSTSASTDQSGQSLRPVSASADEPSSSIRKRRKGREPGGRFSEQRGSGRRLGRQGGPPARFSADRAPESLRPMIRTSTIEQYGIQAGPKIHFPVAEQSPSRGAILWVLKNDGAEPRRVRLGITDGRETAILTGDLEEGENVITWKLDEEVSSQRAASPFSGAFGPRRNRGGSRGAAARGSGGGRRGGGR